MKICSIEGCGRKHNSKGLCATHYQQQRYKQNQVPVTENTPVIIQEKLEMEESDMQINGKLIDADMIRSKLAQKQNPETSVVVKEELSPVEIKEKIFYSMVNEFRELLLSGNAFQGELRDKTITMSSELINTCYFLVSDKNEKIKTLMADNERMKSIIRGNF